VIQAGIGGILRREWSLVAGGWWMEDVGCRIQDPGRRMVEGQCPPERTWLKAHFWPVEKILDCIQVEEQGGL